jgi:hypothetical protein
MLKKRLTKIVLPVTLSLFAAGAQAANLAVNGGFETGDFTDWSTAVNSGSQAISMDTPFGSSFSAFLTANTSVGAGGTTEIKQANRGAGVLALGDTINIQFDVKGSFGPAGQLNVLSFTEFGGGGGTLTDNTIIAGGITDWTHFNYDIILNGPDAGGGFSLAFNPVCGAVTGCFSDIFIDNVEINTSVVPVPAAVWLFGSGLLGLVGVARRKKAA